jgi:hypothetical protein
MVTVLVFMRYNLLQSFNFAVIVLCTILNYALLILLKYILCSKRNLNL